jgi:hypothetical protein
MLLVELALFLQLCAEPDDVLSEGLALFVIHD